MEEEKKPVLFIFGDSKEIKEAIINRLSKKVPTLIITTEYIPSDFDNDKDRMPEDLLSQQKKIDRRNSSIQRAFTNTGVKVKNELFIIDLENVRDDLLAQYSFAAKFAGCRLITLHISESSYHNGKHIIFLKSNEFQLFAKFFLASTEQSKIISASEKKQRHIDFVTALHTGSELIVIDFTTITDDDYTMYSELGNAYDFSVLKIETGVIDVQNPKITMQGRPLPLPKKIVSRDEIVTPHEETAQEYTPLPPSNKDFDIDEWFEEKKRGLKNSLLRLFGKEITPSPPKKLLVKDAVIPSGDLRQPPGPEGFIIEKSEKET
jgi:hypothetical protein